MWRGRRTCDARRGRRHVAWRGRRCVTGRGRRRVAHSKSRPHPARSAATATARLCAPSGPAEYGISRPSAERRAAATAEAAVAREHTSWASSRDWSQRRVRTRASGLCARSDESDGARNGELIVCAAEADAVWAQSRREAGRSALRLVWSEVLADTRREPLQNVHPRRRECNGCAQRRHCATMLAGERVHVGSAEQRHARRDHAHLRRNAPGYHLAPPSPSPPITHVALLRCDAVVPRRRGAGFGRRRSQAHTRSAPDRRQDGLKPPSRASSRNPRRARQTHRARAPHRRQRGRTRGDTGHRPTSRRRGQAQGASAMAGRRAGGAAPSRTASTNANRA